jgi:hypothetical protein
MANTFVQIATYTAPSSVSSIDFSLIPSTYTDLVVKVSARTSKSATGSDWIKIAFNGSSANQTARVLYGEASTASSYSDTLIYSATASNSLTASTFGSTEFYIPNYAGSTNKSLSSDAASENNSSSNNYLNMVAGLWSQTAAINQITLTPYTGPNFLQYSTATLYGIKNS